MAAVQPLENREVQSKVLQNPGPVALDFYGESCPPCHALEPRLERVAGEYAERLSVYRLDAERDLPLAESLGVTSLPTVLIFRDARGGLPRGGIAHGVFMRWRIHVGAFGHWVISARLVSATPASAPRTALSIAGQCGRTRQSRP